MITLDTWVNSDCTVGRLTYKDFKCLTLELPWKNNIPSISCIPSRIYNAKKYESPSKGDVILLQDVPNRDFIEIHAGNFTRQIKGCILVGSSLQYLDQDSILDVGNSKRTLGLLLDALPETFQINVKRVG